RETLSITDRAYLLFEGRILFHGTPWELATNSLVREKYLGKDYDHRDKDFIRLAKERGEYEPYMDDWK
ncbi:MAG: LPS export ABC transporter ATP-binding protein, partial [Bacteroidaceae bacterium]|nr:LPS export ABC transporter ATP-binding protein [Bacteroidaceae bacterium]